jgi:O-antigen ligase
MLTFQAHWRRPGNAIGVLVAAGLGVLVVFAAVGTGELDWFIESTLQKLTKSGSTDELATATGRTDIWAYGIKKIAESPLVGYGYCSARFIMDEHSFHCHNIILNALMYGGVVPGLIVVGMLLYQLTAMINHPIAAIDGVVLLMCVAGMVDELLGAPSPAAAVTLWFSLLWWRQLGMQLTPPS